MNGTSLRLAAGAALLASLGAASTANAASPNYTYAEAGYQSFDFDGGADGDGFEIGGSFALTDMFHLFGNYADGEIDDSDLDASQLTLGGGINYAIQNNVDLVGRLSFEDVEVGDADESGFGIFGGVRAMLTNELEVNGGIQYVDLGDELDDTTFGLGALYSITPQIAVGVGFETGDDVDRWNIGVRWYPSIAAK
jgi:hypothetical protein